MTSPIRVLIVDDEAPARRYLRELLKDEEGVALVGEAATGAEGLELIERLAPGLVLLDIQMPDLDGLSMAMKLAARDAPPPLFVFVTGYDEYAVKAFEIEAVDYLCKPFGRDRLSLALDRVARRLRPAAPPQETAEPSRWLTRLAIKEKESIVFLPVEQILWVEAANKYVVIHAAGGDHILRQTIQSLENQLDPDEFLRIHRSILVRKAAVRGLHPLFHGDYVVKLVTGAELTLSRTYREGFFGKMSR
jgi:two-component system LytT family response regulator